jgi:hypothetical protein
MRTLSMTLALVGGILGAPSFAQAEAASPPPVVLAPPPLEAPVQEQAPVIPQGPPTPPGSIRGPGDYIGFVGDVPGRRASAERYDTWADPYLGDPSHTLEMADFYRRVGRPDLAERYQSAVTLRAVLIGIGVVVLLAGVLDGALAFNAYSLFIDGSGAGFIIGGAVMDPNPISAAQARDLAAQYDGGRLSNRMRPAEPHPGLPLARLSLRPLQVEHGRGLALQLTF